MAFSFIKLISSSDTLTKREAVIFKICPPAIITSAEVIIAEYDAILGQWEREDFYNHLCNYTVVYSSLYNNKINARVLIGQSAMVYCAGKPMEKSRILWIIIESIGVKRKVLEEFVNHSPAARDLQILLVFYQHPAWFISL